MSSFLKNLLPAFLLAFPLFTFGQCKYTYKQNDAITNETTFRTKPFVVAKKAERKGVYILKSAEAWFEKTSQGANIEFSISFKDKSGKSVMFSTLTDSLILKFEDGSVISLKMINMPSGATNGIVHKWTLTYEMSEEVLAKLKSGAQVKAVRIMSTNFNMDISEFSNSITDKFLSCWVG